jgi:hypothetical protein
VNYPVTTKGGRMLAGIVAFGLIASGAMIATAALFEYRSGPNVEARCRNLDADIQILNHCETAKNCTYTYDDLEKLVHGYVGCVQKDYARE